MRLHGYVPPVRAAAMYAIGTPDELAAATARAVERLQGDEHVDPLAEAYQAVLEAAGRRMARAFSSQAMPLTATGDIVRDTIAGLGVPLVRLEQRRQSLEDLFRDELPSPAAQARPAGSAGQTVTTSTGGGAS